MTYEQIIDNLNNGKNFSFARYGDGEFNAILGASSGQDPKQNCDGHRYFKDMGMRLYKIVKSKPKYVMGLQNLAKRLRGNDPDFLELIDGIDWVDSDVMHRYSIRTNGNLKNLFDAIQQRDVILVAHDGLISMEWDYLTDQNSSTLYNHVIISRKNCWLEYDEILKRLKKLILPDTVILYCASMATEVLIDDIYNEFGTTLTQIDIGSLFDPFVGDKTRGYHHKLKL